MNEMSNQFSSGISTELNYEKLTDAYIKRATSSQSICLDLHRLPQFMQDYLAVASSFTDAIPGALLTAWLPVVAVSIGNSVYISNRGKNNYCTIWALITGPSSTSRKSTCLRLAIRTLDPYIKSLSKLPIAEMIICTPIINNATNSKMLSMFADNPVRLLEYHEFATLLKSAKNTYNSGLKENLTMLYDGDSKTICNMERQERIISPAISILAASTEGWIYSDFQTASEQNSGFLQRFVYCIIRPTTKAICTEFEETIPDYDPLYAYDKQYSTFRSIPNKHCLKISVTARKLWIEHHDRVLNETLIYDDDDLLAYATRIFNNLFCSLVNLITLMKHEPELKAAIEAKTCDQFFERIQVSEESTMEALYLCQYYLDNAKPLLNIITEGGAWHNERRIIKFLLKQPEQKASHSTIMSKLHLKSREMAECSKNLEEQNVIRIDLINTPNTMKPTKVYNLLDLSQSMYQ